MRKTGAMMTDANGPESEADGSGSGFPERNREGRGDFGDNYYCERILANNSLIVYAFGYV